jgi:hypothetical protein
VGIKSEFLLFLFSDAGFSLWGLILANFKTSPVESFATAPESFTSCTPLNSRKL